MKKNIGSTLDSFLREQGVYQQVTAVAIKRLVTRQLESPTKEQRLTKSDVARKLKTHRPPSSPTTKP